MVKILVGSFIIGTIMVLSPVFIAIFRMVWEDHPPVTAFMFTVGWGLCIVPFFVTLILFIFS